jgi:hypothetical protein
MPPAGDHLPTLFHLVVILRTSRQEGWQLGDVARYASSFIIGQHFRCPSLFDAALVLVPSDTLIVVFPI